MTPDEWLQRLADAVRSRVPDADVDDVDDGCLAICRGHAAVAVSAVNGMAMAMASLGRGSDGPWAADRVAHEDPLLFTISEASIDGAAEQIASLLI